MRLLHKILVGAVAVLGLAMPAMAAERAIIVLDASGSMWAQIDGKARITIARETLDSVLSTISPDVELGLMAYGHRKKGDCGDIEMLVEPAAGTAEAIKAAVADINPKGMTPLSDAVRLAAEDLKYTEEKSTVILITDGLETCEVDPCALGTELEQKGVDFTVHVLGFGLSDDEGKQVACLAENTGGKYLSAQDGASLVQALTETVAEVAQPAPEPAPEPKPAVADYNFKPSASLAEGGPDIVDDAADLVWTWYKVAADGGQGEYVGTDYYSTFKGTLEPGDYIITATMGYAIASQTVTIKAGAVAEPHFVLDAAVLKVHPRPSKGADVDSDATVNVVWPKDQTTFYGEVDTVVPAGDITLNVSIGAAKVVDSFTAAAGETVDKDIVVGSGIAQFQSEYVEGQPVEDDIYLEVFEAKKALDGTRKSVIYGYGGDQTFDLAQGDYVVTYDLDGTKGEIPFSVKTAEKTDVTIVLDAGVLAVTTPADNYVELFSATKDIKGNRQSFDYGYGPSFETTLKAGDYVILSRDAAGVDFETPVTIVAGQRNEITLTAPAVPTGKKK
ncbi:Ca-activated chloride channel family protein [Devosia sp. UYZn731]|uniref:vWA domain-containing protein n=1 Tax=Devosia sp. UYZn731 TaxID=3156345 RepID=UPI0033964EDC